MTRYNPDVFPYDEEDRRIFIRCDAKDGTRGDVEYVVGPAKTYFRKLIVDSVRFMGSDVDAPLSLKGSVFKVYRLCGLEKDLAREISIYKEIDSNTLVQEPVVEMTGPSVGDLTFIFGRRKLTR